jgi:hypothetical protein
MIAAVVMVGDAEGENDAVAWVQGARRAAAYDLLDQLARQPLVERLILLSPTPGRLTRAKIDRFVRTMPGSIHVGELLARLVQEEGITHLFYSGGGAAPLLSDATLTRVLEQVADAEQLIVANNRFATDWAGVAPASALGNWVSRLPRDNMLGWVLSTEAGLPVQALPPTAESRLDIDTPLDLQLLRLHPQTKPHLRRFLRALPLDTTGLQKLLEVLATPASHVFISGRIGPEAWSALNGATHAWLRVVAEERGMVSSGRQARGEVFSLVGAQVEALGMEAFFGLLAERAHAALIDTRVLLAHHGLWPDATVRFASDLGQVAQVTDSWLRSFTEQALAASIPIILGGHGLMSGDLFGLVELLAATNGPQG